MGLDWPKSHDVKKQQSSLTGIVRTLKQQNFNTIFFQVRARGDAYYTSSYEPWAENLTGVPGRNPGYDPLAFLIEQAHKEGIEVHAWFNLYKVGSTRSGTEGQLHHVAGTHPDWVYRNGEEVWLNPGNPLVNPYLIRVALEIVRKYDIDGIQFDFIRYSGPKISDDAEYQRFGKGVGRADWRRSNVDKFVEAFYDSAELIKPLLKVGATPVGNFDPSAQRPSGFAEFYQNAVGWMERGKIDYVVPQIYWDIGNSPDDPDFAALARMWSFKANGRHVYAGIAPYKPEVLRELHKQIDTARAAGCSGHAFFRLSNLGNFSALRGRYAHAATIPWMAWKTEVKSAGPWQLAVTPLAPGVYHVEWSMPDVVNPMWKSYRIYRSTIPWGDESVATVTGNTTTFLVDTVSQPPAPGFTYTVTALDEHNRETLPSPAVSITMEGWEELMQIVTTPVRFSATIDPDDNSRILIAYSLPSRLPVSIVLQQDARTTTNPLLENLIGEVKQPGTYVVGVDRKGFPAGEYYMILRAGDVTINRHLALGEL